jgi:hypothetical protein
MSTTQASQTATQLARLSARLTALIRDQSQNQPNF